MRRIGLTLFLMIGAGACTAQAALATTTTVGCTGLQSALNAAATGDVIKLDQLCTNQSFSITNTNRFTLEGASPKAADGFNGGSGGNPILSATSNVSMTIENLVFENASTQFAGSAVLLGGAVTLKSDKFIHDVATDTSSGRGGAVNLTNSSGLSTPITISASSFSRDGAADGGAVYVNSVGPVRILHDKFTGNGILPNTTYFYPNGGALDIESYGGVSSSRVTVAGSTFGGTAKGAGNSAPAWGGAVYVSLSSGSGSGKPPQTLTLTKNKFIDNRVTGAATADHLGGAIAFAPQVTQSSFNVVQSGNLFQGNLVGGTNPSPGTYMAGGGAEWGTHVSIKSTRDRFLGNRVTEASSTPAPEGGAVGVIGYGGSNGVAGGSFFTGTDDVFLHNSLTAADGWGGAIYTGGSVGNDCNDTTCPPSHLSLFDSTLSGNRVSSSSGEGAAIWGGPHDTLAVYNSIVFGNVGRAHTSEIFGYRNPRFAFADVCTVAGGTAPRTGAHDICANPKLASSGAETPASPTIDKGSNALVPKGLTTDVLGNKRITEGRPTTCKPVVDIGAFESRAVTPAPSCK